jgi:hypothetical protein
VRAETEARARAARQRAEMEATLTALSEVRRASA